MWTLVNLLFGSCYLRLWKLLLRRVDLLFGNNLDRRTWLLTLPSQYYISPWLLQTPYSWRQGPGSLDLEHQHDHEYSWWVWCNSRWQRADSFPMIVNQCRVLGPECFNDYICWPPMFLQINGNDCHQYLPLKEDCPRSRNVTRHDSTTVGAVVPVLMVKKKGGITSSLHPTPAVTQLAKPGSHAIH